MFLGSQDTQLGVYTSRVISSMVDGVIAQVNKHDELEVYIAYSNICCR